MCCDVWLSKYWCCIVLWKKGQPLKVKMKNNIRASIFPKIFIEGVLSMGVFLPRSFHRVRFILILIFFLNVIIQVITISTLVLQQYGYSSKSYSYLFIVGEKIKMGCYQNIRLNQKQSLKTVISWYHSKHTSIVISFKTYKISLPNELGWTT